MEIIEVVTENLNTGYGVVLEENASALTQGGPLGVSMEWINRRLA